MNMKRLASGLCALTTVLAAASASAANLKMEVQVAGQSDFVRLIPGSGTGGRVFGTGTGRYTDRVQRGELLRFTVTQESQIEVMYNVVVAQLIYDRFLGGPDFPNTMPSVTVFRVPTNPDYDNPRMRLKTLFNEKYFPVPIGSR